jgi:carboxymethylenebutenolidase
MNLFQKYLVDEFVEDYQENRLSRREALKLIASIVGSLVIANSILAACTPLDEETVTVQPVGASPTSGSSPQVTSTSVTITPTVSTPTSAEASATPQATETTSSQPTGAAYGTVTADDPMVNASAVEFSGQDATLKGYLSRPSSGESAPVILVCHENRGLTEHIQDVTRRLAKAGYVALAVDLLSRQGGSGTLSSGDIPGLLTSMSPDQYVQDFVSGWQWLQEQDFTLSERVGMTGFCYGGGVTWRVATQMPELKAAVPFYGPHPELNDVANIHAAVLAIYGELDTRINSGIDAIEAAMQQNSKIYSKIIYPAADHAFFNDTGSRYNQSAAQDAWMQMLAWFQQYV